MYMDIYCNPLYKGGTKDGIKRLPPMARHREALTTRSLAAALKSPGMHIDGQGLYLRVASTGNASWIYRYTSADGRRRDMGLGPYPVVGLANARELAMQQRRLRSNGDDPLTIRRVAAAEKAKTVLFRDATAQYIAAKAPGWKGKDGGKSRRQWEQSMRDYAFPLLGVVPVQAVDLGVVLKVLEPIWTEKPETANRVRGRIEKVLDWAASRRLRSSENPARWKGMLEHHLTARGNLTRVQHFAALPYEHIGAFMQELRARDGMAARALEFCILTAARPGEVIGSRDNGVLPAPWSEIDMKNQLWIKSAERTKADRAHRVPLSDAAMAILKCVQKQDATGAIIFPKVSDNRLRKTICQPGITAHGFRSTFRTWAEERTSYPYEVRELSLAHSVGTNVERTYQRGDLLDRRRRLMDDWARFCTAPATGKGAEVVSIRR